jgi:hypothetical protein
MLPDLFRGAALCIHAFNKPVEKIALIDIPVL